MLAEPENAALLVEVWSGGGAAARPGPAGAPRFPTSLLGAGRPCRLAPQHRTRPLPLLQVPSSVYTVCNMWKLNCKTIPVHWVIVRNQNHLYTICTYSAYIGSVPSVHTDIRRSVSVLTDYRCREEKWSLIYIYTADPRNLRRLQFAKCRKCKWKNANLLCGQNWV